MKLNKNSETTILIVGLGLLGGSYAKALKKKGYTVIAIEKRQSAIDYALENEIIDEGMSTVDRAFISRASLVVFALYPKVFLRWIDEFASLFKAGVILTDVTGVKSCIVDEVQSKLPDGVEFIAAHPMAGREVYGVENSDDRIFQNANFIVVPTEKNTQEGIDTCKELGRELGFSDISVLSAKKHDEMIAFLSQLTHCIAVSLMCASDDDGIVHYTGDSFRDLTRIARINEDMWTELFMLNRSPLLYEMENFSKQFERLYSALKDGDEETMKEMMKLSTRRRALFDKKGSDKQ